MSTPLFILSLDFELHWGVFDHTPLDAASRAYFERTRALIPVQLALFQQHGIRATWATVGFLFAQSKEELLGRLPQRRPGYRNAPLNPYPLLESVRVGKNEAEDPYHFAPSLIRSIKNTPGQIIGSHTLSHYYCLESGQDAATFEEDLSVAQLLAHENFGLQLRALVFPRNQFTPSYRSAVAAQGFSSVRTNPEIWFWQNNPESKPKQLAQNAIRLADHYAPVDWDTSFHDYPVREGLHEIPASRFFRPYLPKIDAWGGQALKIRRICQEMEQAAKSSRHYHLWWHPHNIATHPQKNIAALEQILLHYRRLNRKYGMHSASMEDLSHVH